MEEEFEIDTIIFQNLKGRDKDFFLTLVDLKPKSIINLKKLFKAVQQGYACLRYEYIYYELEFKGYRPDGKKKISIKFKINEASRSNLRFGFHADSDYGAGFLVNFITRDVLFKKSRMVFELDLSKNYRGKFVYQVPLGKKFKSLIGAMTQAESNELKDYEKKSQTDLYLLNAYKGYVFYQYKFTKNFAFNTGYEFESIGVNPKISSDTLFSGNKRINFSSQNILSILEFNNLDRAILPRKGTSFQLRFRYIYYSYKLSVSSQSKIANTDINQFDKYDPYMKLYGSGSSYLALNKKNTFVINYDFNILFSNKDNEFDEFYLGSIGKQRSRTAQQAGYRNGEIIARNFVSLNLGYQIDLYKELYIKPSVGATVYNTGSEDQFIKSLGNLQSNSTLKTSGFAITASYIIPKIGPLSITYHESFDRSYNLIHFTLGYKFQIL
jgi:hypothetical protein